MGLIPGINVPSSITGTGTVARSSVLSGHIFNAGLEKPEVLEALLIKFPNYYLLDLSEKIGGVSGTIFSDVYSWIKQDRTRKSATVTNVANGTSATATLTLDITANGSTDLGYFLVGDEFRVADFSTNGRVTAVGNSGGFQTIDVVTYDGSNWSTSKVAANNKIGHRGIDPFHEEEINYAKQDINNVFKFAQNYGYRTTDKASDLVLFTNKKVKRAKLLVL